MKSLTIILTAIMLIATLVVVDSASATGISRQRQTIIQRQVGDGCAQGQFQAFTNQQAYTFSQPQVVYTPPVVVERVIIEKQVANHQRQNFNFQKQVNKQRGGF